MYDKHTHVHIYIAQKTTSKSPVKAEFVKSGCRIKKNNAGFIEPQPPAKSSAVSSSHMTQIRPTVLCANKPTCFTRLRRHHAACSPT